MNRKKLLAIAGAGLALLLLGRWACSSRWPDHDGSIRQTARLTSVMLRRGAEGAVHLAVTGHFVKGDVLDTFSVDEVEPGKLTLVDGAGKAQELKVKWKDRHNLRVGKVTLPEVADGDYTLHAEYSTDLGKGEVDLPLPLYAPARVHVITDRPLYEPGNTVRFRAVVLRAADLAPIDGRPGRWIITDPEGQVLLEEKAPAGEFGVVAGSFPLDRNAQSGTWKVQWSSGEATDELAFAVKPFTLPRFRIEAAAELPFYSPNDPATLKAGVPRLRGAVTYSSGAPVAAAKLEIQWQVQGDWPAPTAWLESLPKQAVTGADGGFALTLPPLPDDLQGQVTLVASLAAVDAAGDRAASSAALLLSENAIAVSAVTELGDGLVQGFSNRVYLRVTTPDGRILQGAKLKVRRGWQPSDPGVDAVVDEDGVAALQLDPGPPVNVVVPARPWRPAPRPPVVSREEAEELLAGEGAPLDDQVEFDRWLPALAPCAKWVLEDRTTVQVGLRVSASGAITAAAAGPLLVERCVLEVARARRLPAGAERMYTLGFVFTSPDLPVLSVEIASATELPDDDDLVPALTAALNARAAAARDCLPSAQDGSLPRALTWRVTAGQKQITLGDWVADPQGDALAAAMPCVTSRFAGARVELAEPAPSDALGLARMSLALPERLRQERPQPTVMLGYELAVSADVPGEPSTLLRLGPGEVPTLRMRMTPILAKPGDTITAELLRGPTFLGELPKELTLVCEKKKVVAKLTPERKATFALPPEVKGFCEARYADTRALVFVQPPGGLTVSVTPDAQRYAPGQQAQLTVRTFSQGKGQKAAVGLFGVDQSLAQLTPLPGADDLSRLAPKVETPSPAFGQLDGQALTMGRIQGANAAAAVIQRVSSIPTPAELDAVVSGTAETTLDAVAELTDRFYVVLAELYAQARAWEDKAPAKEMMKPETMARLWRDALAACAKRGERVDDAFGRKLRLHVLPADLLSLTDPHVVVTGTRLPEDVENWAAWVARKRP